MKFTPKTQAEILAAIKRVTQGSLGPCSICRQTKWQLMDTFVNLHSAEDPAINTIGGSYYPCAVMVCTICGNTHLLNLMVLGLKHIVENAEPEAAQPETLSKE